MAGFNELEAHQLEGPAMSLAVRHRFEVCAQRTECSFDSPLPVNAPVTPQITAFLDNENSRADGFLERDLWTTLRISRVWAASLSPLDLRVMEGKWSEQSAKQAIFAIKPIRLEQDGHVSAVHVL
jgi:hypothetical protein